MMDKFWKVKVDERLEKELRSKIKIQIFVGKAYLYSVFVTLGGFLIKIALPGEKLPLKIYLPRKDLLGYLITYTFEFITICFIQFSVIPFDVLFSAFCLQAIVQFNYLGYILKNIEFKKYAKNEEDIFELVEIVKYYEFLLEFVKQIKKAFSMMFLMQLGLVTGTLCMELYITSTTSGTSLIQIKTTSYAILSFVELALFCLSAEALSDAANHICISIYENDWYLCPIVFKRYLMNVMARAQRKIKFSAGGLAFVNNETLTSVVKVSFSFFTLMRNAQQKNM